MHFEEHPLTAHPPLDERLRQRASRVELAVYCGVALLSLAGVLAWFVAR